MSTEQSPLQDFLSKFYGLILFFMVLFVVAIILVGIYLVADKFASPTIELKASIEEVNTSVNALKITVSEQDRRFRDIQYTDERIQKDTKEILEIVRELEKRGKRTGIGTGSTNP